MRSDTLLYARQVQILTGFACELADWIIVHKHEPPSIPCSVLKCSLFFPPKRLSLHPQWLSLSYVFRWCLCMRYKRTDLCLHAYAHVCHRSGPSNNKHCLLQSTWVSSLGSHSTWTPFTPDACGALCGHMKRSDHILWASTNKKVDTLIWPRCPMAGLWE